MTNLQQKNHVKNTINLKPYSMIVLLVALLISVGLLLLHEIAFYPFVLGVFFGFIMQRSRFCFVSSYRDMLLIRNTAQTRAVLFAIILTTLGFTILHFSTGIDLSAAGRIYPAGFHTVAGGIIFGIGMVLAGACASGCLVRMGEGYVMQYVTFAGLLLGSLLGAWNLDFWLQLSIKASPAVFLPKVLGWPLAIGVQLGLLVLFYIIAMRLENTNKVFSFFKPASNAMSYGKAAVYLTLGNILLLLTYGRPWGITSGLTHFAGWAAGNLGVPVRAWTYFTISTGVSEPERGFLLHPLLFLAFAMVIGSLAASLQNREFRWRTPRTKKYYLAALVGGICMGYGARLAIGCNIGSLYSGISSFSLHGWVFAAALLPGTFWGGKLLVRYLLSE